jgi:hypothetical protein
MRARLLFPSLPCLTASFGQTVSSPDGRIELQFSPGEQLR